MSVNAFRPSRLVVAAAALLVAACSSGTNAAAPTTSNPATTTTTTSVTTTSAGPVTTTAGPSTPGGAPTLARCSTNTMHITLGSGNGAAGHYYVPIIFTNAGATCTITGFPGVFYVGGADQHQIGDAATRESAATPVLVLRNGESASSWVNQVNVDVYDPAVCGPVSADGLRVYPPNNTVPVVLAESNARACANHMVGQDQLTVRTVQMGITPN